MDEKQLQDMTLEEKMKMVSDIAEKLEEDDITLESSFTLYESGVKMLKEINDEIDTVEKKMQILNEQGELEEF